MSTRTKVQGASRANGVLVGELTVRRAEEALGHWRGPVLAAGGMLGAVAHLLALASAASYDSSMALFGGASVLLGSVIFWFHGGPLITGAGLYSLSSAVFVGFAALYWWNQPDATPYGTYIATIVGYWVNWALLWFWPDRIPNRASEGEDDSAVTGWGITVGLVGSALVVGLAVIGVRLPSGNLVQVGVGILAVLMIAAITHRTRRNRAVRRLLIGVAIVIVFSQTVFTGGGRLNLVALGLVAVVVVSSRTQSRLVKTLILGAVVPVLIIFNEMRERLGLARHGRELDGIGSVVQPLRDFGKLWTLHESGAVEPVGLEPFVASALFWIPRAWWEGKPIGFGRELTELLAPHLLDIGQSMAALNQGEWFYAFGWWGVVVMVVLVGVFIRLLDGLLYRSVEVRIASRRQMLILVAVVLAVTDLPNLMWVGTFGYTSRTVVRLAPVLVLVAFAAKKRTGRINVKAREAI